MKLKWNDVKEVFRKKAKICYIILPRQEGKTTLLTEAFIDNSKESAMVVLNHSMREHIIMRMRKFINVPTNMIVTASGFNKSFRGVRFKKLFVDEFCFFDTDKLLKIFEDAIFTNRVDDILCASTLNEKMTTRQFKNLYCPISPWVDYQLLTVKDFETKIVASKFMNGVYSHMTPDQIITEYLTGGLVC